MTMAYPVPLQLIQFGLRVLEGTMTELVVPMRVGYTGNQSVLRAQEGDAYWRGVIRARPRPGTTGEQAVSAIHHMKLPAASFMWAPTAIRHRGPVKDPNGQLLANRKMKVLQADKFRIKIGPLGAAIAGFPRELKLHPGDKVSYKFGARWGFHEVSANQTSYGHVGNGISEWISVQPEIPEPAAIINAPLNLTYARLKAVLVPDSFQGGEWTVDGLRAPFSFAWRQTL